MQSQTKPTPLGHKRILDYVSSVVGDSLHAKRVLSLAAATLGCMAAASMAVNAIGLALAQVNGLNSKHAIKQVDRLLSNQGIDVWAISELWVPFVIASRPDIVVALDWTDFDKDGHSTIALNMVTRHGRATPLIWKTILKDDLKNKRNLFEDEVLQRLKDVLPVGIGVTITADRGFGDVKLYQFLDSLGFGYVIRFRENIFVQNHKGEARQARDWVPKNGRAVALKSASLTAKKFAVGSVVVTRSRHMKDAWCLAVSDSTMSASVAVATYGKRFSIEESFRDLKNPRFGMGLSESRVNSPVRRDRMILVATLASALLTLLGAAGESTGLDMRYKANTSRKRTHSLYRQGTMYYDGMLTMRDEWLLPLLEKFDALLAETAVMREVFGYI